METKKWDGKSERRFTRKAVYSTKHATTDVLECLANTQSYAFESHQAGFGVQYLEWKWHKHEFNTCPSLDRIGTTPRQNHTIKTESPRRYLACHYAAGMKDRPQSSPTVAVRLKH
eukprot:1137663-Pelagomonas_calceolata.AAC.1